MFSRLILSSIILFCSAAATEEQETNLKLYEQPQLISSTEAAMAHSKGRAENWFRQFESILQAQGYRVQNTILVAQAFEDAQNTCWVNDKEDKNCRTIRFILTKTLVKDNHTVFLIGEGELDVNNKSRRVHSIDLHCSKFTSKVTVSTFTCDR